MDNKAPQTVLEFNGSTVRFSRSAFAKKRRIVTHCFSFDVGNFEKDVAGKIRQQLRRYRCRPQNLILALPRYAVLTRFLRLPSQKEEEIKAMVLLQISREGLSGNKQDVAFDYHVVGFDPGGCALVSVFLLQRERLNRYLEIFKKLNIFPKVITLNTQGLLNWSSLQSFSQQEQEAHAIFLLNADHGLYDFNVFANGYSVFSRTFIPCDRDDLEHGPWLIKEIKVSLELFKRTCGLCFKTQDILYVTGSLAEEDIHIFKESIFSHIMRIAVFENLDDRVFFKQADDQAKVSYACVLGLVLAHSKKVINMMPQDLGTKMGHERAWCFWRRFGLYAMGILFIFSALMIKGMVYRIDRLNAATAQLKVLMPLEGVYKGAQQRALVKGEVLKNSETIPAIHAIYESTPVSIFLISLNSSENGEMMLSGFSASVDAVFEYLKVLRQLSVFKNVRLEYTDAKNKGEIKFNIICILKNVND